MAKKSKALTAGLKVAQQAPPVPTAPKVDPSVQIRQDITNLCASIGDRSFVIRQAEGEIISFHAQIDQLRDKLRVLETPNGSQAPK